MDDRNPNLTPEPTPPPIDLGPPRSTSPKVIAVTLLVLVIGGAGWLLSRSGPNQPSLGQLSPSSTPLGSESPSSAPTTSQSPASSQAAANQLDQSQQLMDSSSSAEASDYSPLATTYDNRTH